MDAKITKPEGRIERLEIIEQALRDKNPLFYSLLVRSNLLAGFLNDKERSLMSSYDGRAMASGIQGIKDVDPYTTPYVQGEIRKIKHPWLHALEDCVNSDDDITLEIWRKTSDYLDENDALKK